MKILAYGFPPGTPAGMGIVAERVLSRLSMYHDVKLVSPTGGVEEAGGIDVIPTPPVASADSMQVLQKAMMDMGPDVFWTNQNWHGATQFTRMLNSYYQNTGNEIQPVFYTPTESEEVPPGFEDRFITDHLTKVHLVPFTKPSYETFSGSTVEKIDGEWEYCRDYIPHGVDEIYRENIPYGGFKRMLGLPDSAQMVVVTAGNEARKNLDDWLKAAGKIAESNDDVFFVMHSSPQPKRGDPLYGGWELPRIAAVEGLQPDEDIIWSKDYPLQNVPQQQIAQMYRDADVYLSLSGGEGFGLPVAEALSQGTPCVLTDHMNHRWVADDGALYVPVNHTERMRTGDKLLRADTDEAADMVISLLDDDEAREMMGEAGRDRVEKFTWDRCVREWQDYLSNEVA